jgi:hypothetical protein
MTGFPFQIWAKAHTIKYGTRIKTISKHIQVVPDKYRSIFVGNKIARKNTAIDGEIHRLPPLNENTASRILMYAQIIHIFQTVSITVNNV